MLGLTGGEPAQGGEGAGGGWQQASSVAFQLAKNGYEKEKPASFTTACKHYVTLVGTLTTVLLYCCVFI